MVLASTMPEQIRWSLNGIACDSTPSLSRVCPSPQFSLTWTGPPQSKSHTSPTNAAMHQKATVIPIGCELPNTPVCCARGCCCCRNCCCWAVAVVLILPLLLFPHARSSTVSRRTRTFTSTTFFFFLLFFGRGGGGTLLKGNDHVKWWRFRETSADRQPIGETWCCVAASLRCGPLWEGCLPTQPIVVRLSCTTHWPEWHPQQAVRHRSTEDLGRFSKNEIKYPIHEELYQYTVSSILVCSIQIVDQIILFESYFLLERLDQLFFLWNYVNLYFQKDYFLILNETQTKHLSLDVIFCYSDFSLSFSITVRRWEKGHFNTFFMSFNSSSAVHRVICLFQTHGLSERSLCVNVHQVWIVQDDTH